MPSQRTRLEKSINTFFLGISATLFGTWRRRSLAILSLLIGYYAGSNITTYFLETTGQRAFVVVIMTIIVELLIRLRYTINTSRWTLVWLSLDNFRIGAVYAVVLEAFKLGS